MRPGLCLISVDAVQSLARSGAYETAVVVPAVATATPWQRLCAAARSAWSAGMLRMPGSGTTTRPRG